MILKTTGVKSLSKNLLSIGKSSTVNRIDSGDSKIDEVKSKNMVIPDSLAKFKLLIYTNPEIDFLTLRAKLIFIKLR